MWLLGNYWVATGPADFVGSQDGQKFKVYKWLSLGNVLQNVRRKGTLKINFPPRKSQMCWVAWFWNRWGLLVLKSFDSSSANFWVFEAWSAPLEYHAHSVCTDFYCFGSVVGWNLTKSKHLKNCLFYFSKATFLNPVNLCSLNNHKTQFSLHPWMTYGPLLTTVTQNFSCRKSRNHFVILQLCWNTECTSWPS